MVVRDREKQTKQKQKKGCQTKAKTKKGRKWIGQNSLRGRNAAVMDSFKSVQVVIVAVRGAVHDSNLPCKKIRILDIFANSEILFGCVCPDDSNTLGSSEIDQPDRVCVCVS